MKSFMHMSEDEYRSAMDDIAGRSVVMAKSLVARSAPFEPTHVLTAILAGVVKELALCDGPTATMEFLDSLKDLVRESPAVRRTLQ